jgi:class 3 adenylate cyclase
MSSARVVSARRKVVTVVFADVVGSTALGERVDAETLRWAMQRWFDRMREVVERHGGAIENYIGDAVMAVFGIPVAHEDDALRAARAAAEMRDAVAGLGDELRRARGVELAVRIGVNTGEAVTGAGAAAGSFTAGDMVNVAARLEQAAGPGDILLGRDTFRLVRHAVDAEPVAPLTVKGKRAAVEAFRLVAVAPDVWGRAQRPCAPMVGRQRERQQVLDAFHQAVADRSCQLLTVLGAAGVGKSRLVAEVLKTIDGAATVAAGRCLPYGDGLTWWPLVEALGAGRMLEQAAAVDSAAATRAAELLKPAGAPVVPEEALWAVRKVLEAIARRRPLVLVIDDLQWAEPVFVDLIEHVAEWTRDAPLLLLIMARPELLDTRPGWRGGELNATTMLLESLPETDARDLLGHLTGSARLDDDVAARILATAEGNPLFVEEIVAMLIDDDVLGPGQRDGTDVAGPTAMAVPPTIQALIAARLDRLDEGERAVVEAASIEGKQFARDRIEALVDDGRSEALDAHLRALIRKDLIRHAVVPQYLTSRNRGLFLTDAEYGAFDLRPARAIRAQLWARALHAQILRGDSPAALIRAYTQYAGRMRPLPSWVDRGAVVGIQGGTDVVRQRVAVLQAAGVPLAGVWLQDWVGQRVTSFGSRLLWNWTLNTARYPGWDQMVADLRRQGIRVMTYINPMLADAAGIPGPQRNLYAEALARGLVIRRPDGAPYIVDQGGFSAALIDLTSPAARAWTRGVLRDMAVKFGASGWMADFAEQTPFGGRFANGASGAIEHNRFPDRWSEIQASALARLPDVVDFHRAAFTKSPRWARLLWMGDQTVNWSQRDGMRSALTGMLSGGMSGFALNHSDTGGYTTLIDPPVQRSAELLERWSEMNAFGGAMFRTHEGNRPQLNVQPYSSPEVARAFARWARVFRALAPYRRRLERQARQTGMPIVRPLWLSDARLDAVNDAFTLGPDVLVAPAFAPGAARTTVPFPRGRWTHVWSSRVYPGGRIVEVDSPLGHPAVFVRSGSNLARIIRNAAKPPRTAAR